jgi:hypothetical protein
MLSWDQTVNEHWLGWRNIAAHIHVVLKDFNPWCSVNFIG